MRLDSSFWWGVGVGLAGAWAFHRYVKPVPSPKQAQALAVLAVGIVVVTVAYALTYVGVERFRGDKRSLTYMVLGRDAPRGWTAGTPVRVLAN